MKKHPLLKPIALSILFSLCIVSLSFYPYQTQPTYNDYIKIPKKDWSQLRQGLVSAYVTAEKLDCISVGEQRKILTPILSTVNYLDAMAADTTNKK